MKDKEGFGLPFLNTAPDAGMRQILLPFSHNERIVGSTLYKILDTEWIAGNKAGISEGASCSFYGDPTLYGFMFTPNGRFYVATRQILTPVLTNWLRAGNFQASEDSRPTPSAPAKSPKQYKSRKLKWNSSASP